jgi:ribosome-associated translation inhibitor RaiA
LPTSQQLQVSISTQGKVPAAVRQRAEEKLGVVAGTIREPVLFAELRLVDDGNTGRARPAIAEATLVVNGTPVRAHIAAESLDAAVDLLEERLRRRIVRHEERLHREGKARHRAQPNGAPTRVWRHGDPPTERPEWFDRPYEDREMIRHKTFALEPMTIDEAAFDLDALAHDFYLFTELTTGSDAVIYYDDEDHGVVVQFPEGTDTPSQDGHAVPVRLAPPAPRLDLVAAEQRLEDGGERWVFFVDEATARGHVIYHRYDGHYGLITPGT